MTKKIWLNNIFFKRKSLEFAKVLFHCLAHECTHSMNQTEEGIDRTFGLITSNVLNKGSFEMFTEKEATRITLDKVTHNKKQYGANTWGYNFLTQFVNVIAIAFGVNDRALLSAAIKGKKELLDLLNTNINNYNLTEKMFNTIKLNTNLIYLAAEQETKNTYLGQNILSAFKYIYRVAEELLDFRISNLNPTDLNNLKKTLEKIKIDQEELTAILEGRLAQPQLKERLQSFIKEKKTLVYAKIISLDEVANSENNDFNYLISSIQSKSTVEDILNFVRQNNISIDNSLIDLQSKFEIAPETIKEWFADYSYNFEGWDNSEIFNYIIKNKKTFKKVKPEKITLFSLLKDYFKEKFSPETPLLDEIKSENPETKSWELTNWGINPRDIPALHNEKNNTNPININQKENEK